MAHGTVVITGGSGLIGAGLTRLLRSAWPERHFVILSRNPEAIQTSSNVSAIRANLGKEDLGIDPLVARGLQTRVTEIIHCAAEVKFTMPLDVARQINVEGTRRILDFAQHCPRVEKVAHLSTLYIAGRRPGIIFEKPLTNEFGYFNSYEQSKHEAEHLVVDRMRQLPICIYRLSSLIGHSTTGKVSKPNYFHNIIRLLHKADSVVAIPGDPEAPVDLIPDDWCISALAFLICHRFIASGICHVCAGPAHSLKAEQLVDLIFRVYNANHRATVRIPHLIPYSESTMQRRILPHGALYDLVQTFLPHLGVNQPFDPGATGSGLATQGIRLPATASFIEQVVKRTMSLEERGERRAM